MAIIHYTSDIIYPKYARKDGKETYTEWLENLKDHTTRAHIRRVEHLKQGN